MNTEINSVVVIYLNDWTLKHIFTHGGEENINNSQEVKNVTEADKEVTNGWDSSCRWKSWLFEINFTVTLLIYITITFITGNLHLYIIYLDSSFPPYFSLPSTLLPLLIYKSLIPSLFLYYFLFSMRWDPSQLP